MLSLVWSFLDVENIQAKILRADLTRGTEKLWELESLVFTKNEHNKEMTCSFLVSHVVIYITPL